MSIIETALIFAGIPLLAILTIGGLTLRRTLHNNPPPPRYRAGDPWDRPPYLWTATDEIIGDPHAAHHDPHAEVSAASSDLIGGRASGRF